MLALLLAGCPDTSDGDSGPGDDDISTDDDATSDDDTGDDDTTPTDDQDGDGWTPQQGDCDDGDPTVYPGADENPCDQVDTDCDGTGTGVLAAVGGVEYVTVADALAGAIDGDTVYLCPGTHTEQIAIDAGRTLGVASWSGSPNDTIVDGQDDHTCLYTGLDSAVSVRGLTFQNGWAEPWCDGEYCGGGISSFSSILEVNNCRFDDNYAEHNGAGVNINAYPTLPGSSSATLVDVVFENNIAGSHGGGIRGAGWVDSTISCTRCDFIRDEASSGGAIDFTGYGYLSLTVTDSTFEDNTSLTGGGGAIAVGTIYNDVTVAISDSTFTGNTAALNGGAMEASPVTSFELTDSHFSENSAGDNGGALDLRMASVPTVATIQGSSFANNSAGYSGGGINLSTDRDVDLTIESCEFTSNTSGYSGGGLDLGFSPAGAGGDWYSLAQLIDLTVTGNTADLLGGGLDASGMADIQLDSCVFQDNVAGEYGGALTLYEAHLEDVLTATLTDCVIDGNETPGLRGAIWCSASPGITLVDTSVTSNTGGGACISSTCPQFISINTDLGTGATDNDSYDVWLNYVDLYYDYGAAAYFTCDGTGGCL